jgi:hypothetical protein
MPSKGQEYFGWSYEEICQELFDNTDPLTDLEEIEVSASAPRINKVAIKPIAGTQGNESSSQNSG